MKKTYREEKREARERRKVPWADRIIKEMDEDIDQAIDEELDR